MSWLDSRAPQTWHSGSHRHLPTGGVEDTVAVIWPHPPARFPSPSGDPQWYRGYQTRDGYTWAAAGAPVRRLSVCHNRLALSLTGVYAEHPVDISGLPCAYSAPILDSMNLCVILFGCQRKCSSSRNCMDLQKHLVLGMEGLARGEKKMNALQCARYVYRTEGIRGFYRGLTASYAGISETMICFLIYETLKKHLAKSRFASPNGHNEKGASDFLRLMMAAAFSKGCASCIAYPHEVIRTRLREEGSKYKYFFQTGRLIAVEEGYAAFYRGLVPQLIRQIPNTAIVLSTYELIVHLLGDSK
ncbi:hypothetical protein XENOCAPTIV_030101 [Xenoophorus captivus]|uniref:Solute carrier family 25 member 33 n=1 Tax=Xenoophorus captivus TaxID=1517983 RepID=A0ABV0QPY8_9TELE